MDDVDMPDAGPSVPPKAKTVSKSVKVGGAADDGKKRFEVKKASVHISRGVNIAPRLIVVSGML